MNVYRSLKHIYAQIINDENGTTLVSCNSKQKQYADTLKTMTNKEQAKMFAFMPVFFMFMMGHFASGLIIYWTLSNILSIIQQKTIMKKNGVK